MAKLKDGHDEHFRGKNASFTVYDLNGQVIRRLIGVRVKPFSMLQLANQKALADVTALLKPVKEFLEVGFDKIGKSARKTAHNMAFSYNYHHALVGEHPDKNLDFTKVLFSKGDMTVTEDLVAVLTPEGLSFSWNPGLTALGFKTSDQAMFMAYLPQKKFAVYQMSGVRRTQGTELLVLPVSKRPVIIEAYICFISANHKSVSDSVYMGQFTWKS